MKEIGLEDKVKINFGDITLNGCIAKIEYDRLYIKINQEDIQTASNLNELDELNIEATTHYGRKFMKAAIIEKLNKFDRIIIENNPSKEFGKNRKAIRINCDFNFKIKVQNKEYDCTAKNLSIGGIAFKTDFNKLIKNDKIVVKLSEEEFKKEINCSARVIFIKDDTIAVAFEKLNLFHEDIISKYIFKTFPKVKKENNRGKVE